MVDKVASIIWECSSLDLCEWVHHLPGDLE